MSEIRYKVQLFQSSRLLEKSEAFTENVKRAHLQTCIWKAAMLLDPPTHVWLSQA